MASQIFLGASRIFETALASRQKSRYGFRERCEAATWLQHLRCAIGSAWNRGVANPGFAFAPFSLGFRPRGGRETALDHRDQSVVRNSQVLHIFENRPTIGR